MLSTVSSMKDGRPGITELWVDMDLKMVCWLLAGVFSPMHMLVFEKPAEKSSQ